MSIDVIKIKFVDYKWGINVCYGPSFRFCAEKTKITVVWKLGGTECQCTFVAKYLQKKCLLNDG